MIQLYILIARALFWLQGGFNDRKIKPVKKVFWVTDENDPETVDEVKIESHSVTITHDTIGNAIVTTEEAAVTDSIIELRKLVREFKLTRKVERIVLHCTATSYGATVSGILNYWKKELGWINPGYHLIVKPKGEWTLLADFNDVTNGVQGFNRSSIHISYIGGKDGRYPITAEQKQVFKVFVNEWLKKYPRLKVKGHSDFTDSKTCPNFDVSGWKKKYIR